MNNISKNIKVLSFAILCVGLTIVGCKKYDNPPPVFEELDNSDRVIQRKVLVISIDGVTGSELNTIAPPIITDLAKTGKYTYNVLRGAVTTDASSWVSMLTGTSYSKHQIKDDVTFRRPPADDEHGAVVYYRNVLDYVMQYKSIKTAFVTPWSQLRGYMKQADYAPNVSTDIAVKDSTINLLNTSNSLGAVIVNFKDVQTAGLAGSFTASNAGYKAAILKSDEYVGNILTALKARKNYAAEDWLVIVTTNHGGSEADSKPGFIVLSNKNFKGQEVKKSGFNTVLFNNTSINASVPNDNGLYDSGSSKDFTVQMQVKFNSLTSYPGFLSKGSNLDLSKMTGWLFMETGSNWAAVLGGTGNGGTGKTQINGGAIGDLQWHTLTMTVKTVNATTRTVSTYTDGNLNATANISNTKSLATTEKLTLGYKNVDNGGGALNFHGADLIYFNTALDAATIKANIALKDITKHPNYANVTGYWPINEGGEGLATNAAPGGYDMFLNGGFTWKGLGIDVPASVTPDANATGKSIIVTPATITAAAMYWLKIPILPEFGIDGNPVLNQFEVEFLK
ncbi:alkaline phosphatase family protein [Pedobacter punctiformis]|uniref:Alkaline phosphatase family protein n=1 Tax=Pedobacter punctiformis TaxID=3004097 RepID=A0ABT4LAC8_9SPHI|nr:alkaline phosphatase family protein [Pedobacter sp. HCMS5-2]MCZ4244865.1 alkaline phosphatase family protein [Pedobacter sp. HCMS5-2]